MKHRATGNPKGRPRRLPLDFYKQVFKTLQSHVNPETNLVAPNWRGLARELGVCRSTIARQVAILHQLGLIERVIVPVDVDQGETYYRLNESP